MAIIFHEETREFHLYNKQVSYVFQILKNEQLGQLYYGKRIKDRTSFAHMLQVHSRVLAPCVYRGNLDFSLEVIKQEYPAYGTGDYRDPAYQMLLEDGSRITDFKYLSHEIYKGKKKLENLPATYGEESEVSTVSILLQDEKINCEMILSYH
ncbi:MAG: glycoside hydrolase family 36 N-terminal domain-containing protein, partial [Eubacteriales bacterium]